MLFLVVLLIFFAVGLEWVLFGKCGTVFHELYQEDTEKDNSNEMPKMSNIPHSMPRQSTCHSDHDVYM
mgnify:CR=1 FL=1